MDEIIEITVKFPPSPKEDGNDPEHDILAWKLGKEIPADVTINEVIVDLSNCPYFYLR